MVDWVAGASMRGGMLVLCRAHGPLTDLSLEICRYTFCIGGPGVEQRVIGMGRDGRIHHLGIPKEVLAGCYWI